MKLIHYGSHKYLPELFNKIVNRKLRNKPEGGLWSSPINSTYGWKDWCKQENFRDCDKDKSFIFSLKKSTRLLVIDSVLCLEKIIWIENSINYGSFLSEIDFEELSQRYDAIHLTKAGQIATEFIDCDNHNLYGWDCESVLILNQNCII